MFLDYLFLQLHCHDCRLHFQSLAFPIERCLISAPRHFPMANAKSAKHFLVVNVDRPLHTSCLRMRQQTHEVRFCPSLLKYLLAMLVAATIGSFCFLFFARLHFALRMLSILSPNAFQKPSHENTEHSKQSDRVEY